MSLEIMIAPNFKDIFAQNTAKAFQAAYPDTHVEIGESEVFSSSFILESIEKPKDPTKGRFAFPVFKYGKLLGDNPSAIANKIVELLQSRYSDENITASAIGGFINVQTNFAVESESTLSEIISTKEKYADSDIGHDKNILVEYSAPNIAKPFGIGHIRTTILGNSLRLIFKKLGYETVGINYLGDWGTQFGKMICAYKKWADDSIKGKETIKNLLDLYVKFHEVAEENQDLEDEAREEFKKLENGDPENLELWEKFREISIEEFNRVYQIMGVEFDWITGEAFMNDKMETAIERFQNNGLVSESQGATIVDLHDEQLPPVLLKKADGATLYLTRDIAGFLYRWDKYKFNEMVYVVATNQSVHFQQLFKAMQMLFEKEGINDISSRAKHIDFGLIKFGDKMMSTRRGHIIFLEDVINKAVELAKEKIAEKNPDLDQIDETALQIGLGALFYSQMSVRRQKEVNFSWEEVLSFEGETGPYLQYTHARLCSLLRNFEGEINKEIDYNLLNNPEEKRVVELLADFRDAIVDAARLYDPNLIANHLIQIAGAFNKFYQRKDENGKIDKIISDNKNLSEARIALVKSTQVVLKEGLRLLGIHAPEAM